jgi:cell division protein FtsW
MLKLDRRNTTALGRWWWTIDRTMIVALLLLVGIGMFLMAAASPPVAQRIGLPDFYFVTRHQIFLSIAVVVMVITSMFSKANVRRIALLGLLISVGIMLLLPFIGFENKGAIRWLKFGGLSMQPSEFMKPCFAVVIAWILAERGQSQSLSAYKMAIGVYLFVVMLLALQPDFGMAVTVTAIFGIEFFIAGMPMIWVAMMGGLAVLGVLMAYQLLPHVAARIDRFLDPSAGDNYQVEQSLEAFRAGGLLGVGPGEGIVKQSIPDAHTDFIFAVIGEEFGAIVGIAIIALFAIIVLRGLMRLKEESDKFAVLAAVGILAQFGIQSLINMGVAVKLLPAKGMTLPFLSYGGSSLVAMAFGMGMLLAVTRRRYGKALVSNVKITRRH